MKKNDKEWTNDDVLKLLNEKLSVEQYAKNRMEIEKYLKESFNQKESIQKINEDNPKTVFYF